MSNDSPVSKDSLETRPPVRYTVVPDVLSKVVLSTFPGAICKLRLDDGSDGRQHLNLFADESGRVRFYAGPAKESKTVEKLLIDCNVGAKVIRFPVELRVDSNPTSDMPAPPVENIKTAGDKVRPGLSEQEILNLSYGELIQRGYPPRPHSKKSPEAFSRWKQRVSRPVIIPVIIVDPRPNCGSRHTF